VPVRKAEILQKKRRVQHVHRLPRKEKQLQKIQGNYVRLSTGEERNWFQILTKLVFVEHVTKGKKGGLST
jgi:hypothetical protein